MMMMMVMMVMVMEVMNLMMMIVVLMWQTIPFTSDADEERNLLRELKFNMATAKCPFVVKFFGAFYVDVSYLLRLQLANIERTVHCMSFCSFCVSELLDKSKVVSLILVL